MSFEDALGDRPLPRRIGDARLTCDAQLLVVERVRPASGLRQEALWVAAVALGLLGATHVLIKGAGGVSAGVLALAAAALVLAMRGEWLRRARRAAVLDFEVRVLRLDAPAGLLARPATARFAFSEVVDVAVEPSGPGLFCLELHLERTPGGERHVQRILDGARAEDVEPLRRLWRLLRGAFALSAPIDSG